MSCALLNLNVKSGKYLTFLCLNQVKTKHLRISVCATFRDYFIIPRMCIVLQQIHA